MYTIYVIMKREYLKGARLMEGPTKIRKSYIRRLVMRSIILICVILLYIFRPDTFSVAKELNFIKQFSPLHVLWGLWMVDMILQLCKVPKYWPLGSQKFWGHRFLPDLSGINKDVLKDYVKKCKKDVVRVAAAWIGLVGTIDVLYLTKVISYQIVIILSVVFYVCDLICVIVWCPFKRFFMHNKCCTTCRIFNWDHAMMFLPLIAIPGIWTWSLVGMSIAILIVWEVTFAVYPERFNEITNCALRCQNCPDVLCGKRKK